MRMFLFKCMIFPLISHVAGASTGPRAPGCPGVRSWPPIPVNRLPIPIHYSHPFRRAVARCGKKNRPKLLTRQGSTFFPVRAPRGCTRDEGRPLGVGLQEQAPNHLKLHLLRAGVVSVKEKALLEVSGMNQQR